MVASLVSEKDFPQSKAAVLFADPLHDGELRFPKRWQVLLKICYYVPTYTVFVLSAEDNKLLTLFCLISSRT